MAQPNLMDLLRAQFKTDLKLAPGKVPAIKGLDIEPTPIVEDEFGGNDNNRRAAERIAKERASLGAQTDAVAPAGDATNPNPDASAANAPTTGKSKKAKGADVVVPVWKP